MPITNQEIVNEYTGNGSTTEFAYEFRVIDSDQLSVYIDGALQASGYTVDGVDEQAGGTVTFTSAPTSGKIVRLVRETEIVRETDYINGGGLQARTLDNDQDYQTMVLQELDQSAVKKNPATGDWDADGERITNVGAPDAGTDAATAAYVDQLVTTIIAGGGASVPQSFSYTGDDSTTQFALSGINVSTNDAYIVTLDGVRQTPTADYSVSVGSQLITFTEAPPDGSAIVVSVFGYARTVDDVEALRTDIADSTNILTGHRMQWLSAAPSTGTWSRGDVVWNTGVSAGGSPGWVCVTAGTPGTWKTMAVVAS